MKYNFKKKKMYKARMIKKYAKEILNAIDNDKFFIKVKFIRNIFYSNKRYNYAFKIINKYQPI